MLVFGRRYEKHDVEVIPNKMIKDKIKKRPGGLYKRMGW